MCFNPKGLFFVILCCCLTTCGLGEEKVNIRLTMAERSALDTRVVDHMDSLRIVLDSICTVKRADRIAAATDSIVQRRLEEEARLRSRIPKITRK